MKYEIIKMDGLYVIFKGEKLICACETIEDAKERISRYKTTRQRKEQTNDIYGRRPR